MDILAIFIGALLLMLTVTLITQPFRLKTGKAGGQDPRLSATVQRERVLSSLRDLDFDFKTGKVSEADYTPVRAQLLVEAAELLKREEQEEEQLEALIRSRRQQKANVRCGKCDAPVEAGQQFCAKCGTPVVTKTCPACGNRIKPGDQFCTACGSRIVTPVEATAQA
ncbi:MAG: zinc ribbon domain-containing protein [Bacteroidota bacterium]